MSRHKWWDWSEDDLEDYFCKQLDKLEIFHKKGKAKGQKGYPDREVFIEGIDIEYVELKLGKEHKSYYKQSPMQKWWQRKIEGCNRVYILLEGKTQVDDYIDGLKTRKKGTKL